MKMIKYILVFGLPFCLFFTSVEAQLNVDSDLHDWQDTTLGMKERLTALYDTAFELVNIDSERALSLYSTFNIETSELNVSSHFDTMKIKILKTLSFRYIYIQPDTAIKLSRQMLLLSKIKKDIKQQIRAYRRLGMAYEKKTELDSAYKYFSASMKLRRETKDDKIIAIGYEDYAGLMMSNGRYDSALIYYDSSLQTDQRLNLEEEMASGYNNKGIAYYYLGDIRNAIDNYYLSMAIEEKKANYEGVAGTKNNIGLLYHKIGDLDKASKYIEESYQYYKDQHPSHVQNELKLLSSLASIESDKGNYEDAKHSFTNILGRAKELDDSVRVASILMNRGLVNARLKDYKGAILDYKKALLILRQLDAIQKLKITLANLGDTYLKMDSLDAAMQVSQEVIELHKKSSSIVEAIVAYRTLFEANKKRGLSTRALQMFENHILLRDSLTSEKATRRVIEKEYEYQYEKKVIQEKAEQEKKLAQITFFFIGLLFATILFFLILQKIRKQRFQIEKKYAAHKAATEKEDAERSRFSRDLHDSVGSTLTLSLFNLESLKHLVLDQSQQMKNLQSSISSIQTAVDDIRRISHDLMPKSLESGGLIPAAKELMDKVSSHGIQVQSRFPESLDSLSKSEEVQVYRIIKGLVSNTLKYAEASLITLSMEKKDNIFNLTYKDNGKGMKLKEALEHSRSKGQGLVGIQERSILIGAEHHIDSSLGNGFTFNLTKEI